MRLPLLFGELLLALRDFLQISKDFVGLAEQGTLPAKDWIPLSQSVETVELHVWLVGKLLASALVNLVPQLSDGVN